MVPDWLKSVSEIQFAQIWNCDYIKKFQYQKHFHVELGNSCWFITEVHQAVFLHNSIFNATNDRISYDVNNMDNRPFQNIFSEIFLDLLKPLLIANNLPVLNNCFLNSFTDQTVQLNVSQVILVKIFFELKL